MISLFLTWLDMLRRLVLAPEHPHDSIQKMVHDNFLGKRQNSRISYSHIGAVGELPRVYFQNDELNVGNLSVGGLLIVDDNGRLGTTVGEMIYLEFKWKDISVKIRSRVVGANLQRRHIQFVDTHVILSSRLQRAVQLGHPGTKFHRVQLATKNIEATEIWMDAAGSSLIFRDPEQSPYFAELAFNGSVMSFDSHAWPKIKLQSSNGKTETIRDMTMTELSETLLLLANVKDASSNVQFLVERLHHFHERPTKRAG